MNSPCSPAWSSHGCAVCNAWRAAFRPRCSRQRGGVHRTAESVNENSPAYWNAKLADIDSGKRTPLPNSVVDAFVTLVRQEMVEEALDRAEQAANANT